MNKTDTQQREILEDIANRAMLERGLLPDFSNEAIAELGKIQAPATANIETARDLRDMTWASIDNDKLPRPRSVNFSRCYAGRQNKGNGCSSGCGCSRKKGSAIDEYARHNTTSVYTAAKMFPMLPEKLSTNLTSLNFNEDRLAIVMEIVIGAEGSLQDWDIYRAIVRNHAKLAYNGVAAWLEGKAELPPIAAVKGLAENLRLQDKAAQTIEGFAACSRGAKSRNY
jgi:exoribonuclease-2